MATKKTATKKKRGRPTVYKEEYVEQVYKLCCLGADNVKIADFFGVNQTTIHDWCNRYENFSNAKKAGKEKWDTELVEKSLCHRAIGYSHPETKINVVDGEIVETRVTKHYPPDAASAIFWLKNRNPGRWRDKQVLEADITTAGESLNDGPSAEAVEKARLAILAGLKKDSE